MQESTVIDQLRVSGQCLIEVSDAETGEVVSSELIKNLVVDAGKNNMARLLSGVIGVGQITHCAVGTGVSAPTSNNTQLQSELTRKEVPVRQISGNTAIFKTFFNSGEANGNLREAGLFGDGATLAANSGTLFCRLNMNIVKHPTATLTLTWMVTVG